MLHFAHFEKRAERLDQDHYLLTLKYRERDEAEMVILVLSFGPCIQALGPDTFLQRLREKLRSQQALLDRPFSLL